MNNHVNNVKYLEWVMECVPADVRDQKQISKADIVFKAESKYGDEIRSESISNGKSDEFLHVITRTSDNRELSLAKTLFA